MGKALRQELHQLRCRAGAWALLAIALVGWIVIGVKQPVGAERAHVDVRARCFYLYTRGEMEMWVNAYLKAPKTRLDTELAELLPKYGLEPGSAKDGAGIYSLLTEAEYTRILWFGGGILLLCVILPAVMIRYPLDTGMPDWSGKFCGSRKRVVRAKLLVCHLLALLLSLIYVLVLIPIYAGEIISRQGIGFVLGTLAVHTLMELAMLSIPLYIAFRCRSIYACMGFNTLYGLICYGVNVAAHYRDGVLFIPFPAWLHGLRSLWQPESSPLWLGLSALVSLGYIALFGWLSVRCFDRSA